MPMGRAGESNEAKLLFGLGFIYTLNARARQKVTEGSRE